ncbi:MAG: hypothetical protein QM497_09315 [Sulfurimonas sp.]
MKQLIIAIMVLVGLSTTTSANDIDKIIKKQCQYLVYESGKNNIYINMYMMDVIAEELGYEDKITANQIKKRACKEALNNDETKGFESKYKFEVAILIENKPNVNGDPKEN